MHEHSETLRARCGNIEPVAVEQEPDAARYIFSARAGHRVKDDRRLLPLELVDGPDAYALRKSLANASHSKVVGRDDEDVLWPKVAPFTVFIEIDRTGEQVATCSGNRG